MKNDTYANTISKAKDQIAILLDEEQERIKRSMSDAAMIASQANKEKFAFKVRLTIEIEPCGEDMNVGCAIGYGVSHKVKVDKVSVSNQPELIK